MKRPGNAKQGRKPDERKKEIKGLRTGFGFFGGGRSHGKRVHYEEPTVGVKTKSEVGGWAVQKR